jgi:hypothetical protein
MNDRSSVRALATAAISNTGSPESTLRQPCLAWETGEPRRRGLERLLAMLLTTLAFAALFFLLQPLGLAASCFGGLVLAGPMTPFFHELVTELSSPTQG